MVLKSIDEQTDIATFELYFRTCNRGIPDLGCSPYFIGGIPFQKIKTGDTFFLGQVPNHTGTAASIPTSAAQNWWTSYQAGISSGQSSQNNTASNTTSSNPETTSPTAATSTSTQSTASASSDTESAVLTALSTERTSDQIGPSYCDSSGNCAVLAGTYGVPSNTPAFRDEASPELVAALDQLSGQTADIAQTSPQPLAILVSNPSHQSLQVNGINLREKFKEDFPDGGEAVTRQWLREIVARLPNQRVTAEQLTRAVLGGTHLPSHVSGVVVGNKTIEQTVRQMLQTGP